RVSSYSWHPQASKQASEATLPQATPEGPALPARRVAPLGGRSAATGGLNNRQVLGAGRQVAAARAVTVQLDLQPQVVDRIGVSQRVFVGDHLVLVEVEQRLVEGLHAELARALHDLLDLRYFALEDQ